MPEAETWSRLRRNKFLRHLRETGNVSAAAAFAGRDRSSAYRLRKRDAEFASEWKDALDGFLDDLEEELFRRALKGSPKPVFYGGKKSGTVCNYNDALGMFLLRAKRPGVFGERGDSGGAPPEDAPEGTRPRDILERRLAKLGGEKEIPKPEA